MRIGFSIIFIGMIIGLITCAVIARRSKKAIGSSVAFFLTALIMPMAGNLVIIVSSEKAVAEIGCYTYYLGMDLMLFALGRFTMKYCELKFRHKWIPITICTLLIADVIQFLLNPFFRHAFDTEPVLMDGKDYYRLVPHLGQTYHRIIDYGLIAAILIVFLVMVIRTPKISSEKYSVILITLFIGMIWQTVYIFSRSPVDRSMIGFGVCGIVIFFLSLYYRPMRLMDRMLGEIVSDAPSGFFIFDTTHKCIWANATGLEMVHLPETDLDKVPDRLRVVFGEIEEKASDEWQVQKVIGMGSEIRYYTLENRKTLNKKKNKVVGTFLRVVDLTEERRELQKEIYNATHDPLTGLYTREYLYMKIEEMMQAHPGIRFYTCFLDVNEFKIVNDIYGTDFGDYALKCVADWIRGDMTKHCVYGRLAGDTFGVFIPVEEFDRKKVERDMDQFTVNDGQREHHLLMHLGVYEVTEKGIDVSVMFDRAHMAIAPIKGDYKTHIAFYDDALRRDVLWGRHITSELQTALEEKQIRPYLQPIVDNSGKVVGAEALVRWIHPVSGFLSPAKFIPIFEKNGMIAEVDRYMWRSACEILARWKREGHGDVFISVNISPKDFYFMDVVEELKKLVWHYAIDPKLLRVEITETVMMTESEKRSEIITELQKAGFIVEMDDFGSGYSSLNLLKDMPVDVLKIDMAFLRKSPNDVKARTIVYNIIRLAEELGITSLTEGVETEDQFGKLSEMGCRLYQGYYFSKPIPVEEFEKFAFGKSEEPSEEADSADAVKADAVNVEKAEATDVEKTDAADEACHSEERSDEESPH